MNSKKVFDSAPSDKKANRAPAKTLANIYNESESEDDGFATAKETRAEVRKALKEREATKKPADNELVEEPVKKSKEKPEKQPKPKGKHRFLKFFIIFLILVGLGVGGYFFIFTPISNRILGDAAGNEKDAKADDIYYSTLTGAELHEKELVDRPLTCIMIENSPEARPQSGLGDAGIVYEAIAEGGITRFMAIFQEAQPNFIGPVRSVRLTYVELAKPYQCSIAHVGGSDNALKLIRNNNAFRDIDQFFNDSSYWRERSRYAPHNVYTSFEKLDALNKSRGYTSSEFKGFTRVKPDSAPETPEKTANNIKISMSSDLFSPIYNYNAETNKYLRSHANGGPHYSVTQGGERTQNSPDVVIAMKVNAVNRAGTAYADYTTTGSGTAYIFQNGGVTECTWKRDTYESELRFVDANGEDIPLNRGQVWVTLYPSSGKVSWE